MEHGVQPARQLVARRNDVRDACVTDLLLGTDEALSERRLRQQKAACNLRRPQAAEQPKCKHDLCIESQGWVAAGEDQP